MSEHPDKEKWIEMAQKELRGKPIDALTWKTPEGISVKPVYSAEDLEGFAHMNTLSARHDVYGTALDHTPVCRLFHRQRIEHILPQMPGRRSKRPFRGL